MTVINAVPVSEIFRRHGVEIRQNKCCCPFHADDTPSLSIYDNDTKWHCFGCDLRGNVIDAVMQFGELSFMEALYSLDSDYKLGLFGDGIMTAGKKRTSIYAELAKDQKELRETRLAAYEGYFYYDSFLRCFKSPEFENKAQESEFWEAVRLREACERVYEELSYVKI